MAIGVDIVYVPRFYNKEKLAQRILSTNEFEIYKARSNKEQFLAGRFAAKEAFLKAIKEGVGRIAFHNMDVVYQKDGRPQLVVEGKTYPISISHDGDYAIAVCEVKEE